MPQNSECVVCLEPLIERIKVLRCAHRFHIDCIDRWLAINNRCPTCRVPSGEAIAPAEVIIHDEDDYFEEYTTDEEHYTDELFGDYSEEGEEYENDLELGSTIDDEDSVGESGSVHYNIEEQEEVDQWGGLDVVISEDERINEEDVAFSDVMSEEEYLACPQDEEIDGVWEEPEQIDECHIEDSGDEFVGTPSDIEDGIWEESYPVEEVSIEDSGEESLPWSEPEDEPYDDSQDVFEGNDWDEPDIESYEPDYDIIS
ncbi:uncharacterized protein LOC131676791 [Topomyia yanbarensis]|uniref:uncharacterized protein LOC131676791 n=1 Tax=Topomyia yanbarensis TaxID=2498891 RepID=UPI00273B4C58|nr:uncharacterized protein LOC131676791 [Topomyia yanbarensis]